MLVLKKVDSVGCILYVQIHNSKDYIMYIYECTNVHDYKEGGLFLVDFDVRFQNSMVLFY